MSYVGAMITVRNTPHLTYRADIDGLRAVAIVPVVLYHANIPPFGGGYIGVDVFFVISGYLITGFILNELEHGNFSFVNFYLRRIRRIFPALFVMMACCAAVGWFLLSPNDYRRLGDSIFATAAFSSNVLFWLTSGYFTTRIEAQPLLHTWSLGVEEQFYLAFPVFLVVLRRFCPRRTIAITLAAGLLSFGLNVVIVHAHPLFAFFLTPTRIWELVLGALLAMGAIAAPRNAGAATAAAAVGALLIVVAIFAFSGRTILPGFAALMPTLGAAAIIWAGTGSFSRPARLTRLLSHPMPVFVGKISYSLYLWHFPLLALAAYVLIGGPSLAMRLDLIVLSLLLAVLSWIYIEQPVRRGRWLFGEPRAVFGAATATLVVFASFGLVAHRTAGFPTRMDAATRQILAAQTDIDPDRNVCLTLGATGIAHRPSCGFGIPTAAPAYVLWGDSHAESLRPVVDAAARKFSQAGIFFGDAGCIPALGIDRSASEDCRRVNDAIADYLTAAPGIRNVILAGRWGLWAEGKPYLHEGGKGFSIVDRSGVPQNNEAAFTAAIESTIDRLDAAGKQIWLIGPIPEIGYDVPRALYFDRLGVRQNFHLEPTRQEFDNRQHVVLALFAKLANEHRARVIWPSRSLCNDRLCSVQKDGRPLYIDDQHLSRFGALTLLPLFEPIFADAAAPAEPASSRK